jgi:hypothetical protein
VSAFPTPRNVGCVLQPYACSIGVSTLFRVFHGALVSFLECPLPNEAQWGKTGRNASVACTRKIILARTFTFSGERVRVPLGTPVLYLPKTGTTVQLPLPGAGIREINWFLAVAELHGCQRVRTWLDTLDGQDSGLGKFSIEGV